MSYAHTPVLGSATAATSASVRLAHPGSACQDGFGNKKLHPLPAPLHATSDALRVPVFESWLRLVPPTAVTYWELAGNWAP